MRKAPIYHAGSIGYTVSGGIPKVGQLLESAWSITETKRFKIIQPPKKPKLPELPKEKDKQKEDYDSASMPPPPSPASSTCSDGSLHGSRMKKRSAPKEEPEKIDEEEWNLKDVIFVEDSRNMPIGKVIKVDGLHTVVHFPLGKFEKLREINCCLCENERFFCQLKSYVKSILVKVRAQ